MLDSDKSQAKRALAAKADELSSVNSELDKLRAKLDGAKRGGRPVASALHIPTQPFHAPVCPLPDLKKQQADNEEHCEQRVRSEQEHAREAEEAKEQETQHAQSLERKSHATITGDPPAATSLNVFLLITLPPTATVPCAEEISKLQDKHADMQRTHQMLQDDYNKLEENMAKAQATADSAGASLKKLQSDYETLHTRVG
jgi:hypothetical protein